MNKIIVSLFIIMNLYCDAYSYSEGVTHPIISEAAYKKSNIIEFFDNTFYDKGIYTDFDGREVEKIIREGSSDEDKSILFVIGRFYNHFHNPINPYPWGGEEFTLATPLWAQSSTAQSRSVGGDHSWEEIREKFWLSNLSSNIQVRESFMADVFYGLGHQIHLLQDMSVPDHVRMDLHPFGSLGVPDAMGNMFYEKFLAEKYYSMEKMNEIITNIVRPDISFSEYPDGWYLAPSPVSVLFDTDKYNGQEVFSDTSVGLSEYTSSNFFSKDTIFNVQAYDDIDDELPFPRFDSTDVQQYIDGEKLPVVVYGASNVPENKIYIKKIKDGEGVDYFLSPGYLANEFSPEEVLESEQEYRLNFFLDEKCHEDYARRLLPRAVGYSAALLDYFFRAKVDATGVEIVDSTGKVTGMDLRFANRTTGEVLFNPTFAVTGRSRPASESDWGYVVSALKGVDAEFADEDLGKLVLTSFANTVVLPPVDDNNYSDSGESVAAQLISEDGEREYLVAFRGTLGGEPGAVGAGRINLGWREDWNLDLMGNHYWQVSDVSVDNEQVSLWVADDILEMSSVRQAGEVGEVINEIVLTSEGLEGASISGVRLPYEVTPETVIVVNFSSHETSPDLLVEDCPSSMSQQAIVVEFDSVSPVSFLLPGSVSWTTFYADWAPGRRYINIGDEMKRLGLLPNEPVHITGIRVRQEMGELCEPAAVDQYQRLALDYMRIL